jgi:hypothetical protein
MGFLRQKMGIVVRHRPFLSPIRMIGRGAMTDEHCLGAKLFAKAAVTG